MSRGLFLCIEGGDGSGKGAQHELLAEHLKRDGHDILELDFPQYGQPSAKVAESYLNNDFGNAAEFNPFVASMFFAIDRLAAKDKIEKALNVGRLVLTNRFTASNMALQGSKIADRKERLKFFDWVHSTEHEMMGIPEPDNHFVLHVPAAIAQKRVLKKGNRSYTSKKLDGHEADLNLLTRTEQTYLDLAKRFPGKFTVIECVKGDYEKTPEEIHAEIWAKVSEQL